MSSKKKKKTEENELKKGTYKEAVKALNRGLFPSVTACAKHFEVCHTTLGYLVKSGREFTGSGRQSSVFTEEEEEKIVKLVKDRLSLGCGMDFKQLCLLIQELINALNTSNPDREFPSSWEGNFPNESFVRRFIRRNNLVLRRTMNLSTARAMLNVGSLV